MTSALLLFGMGCAGSAQYSASASVETPQLILIEPDVQVVADYHEPVFYSENYYWRFDNGVWYRSNHHARGWVRFEAVPARIRRIERPTAYIRYRGEARGNANGQVRDHRDNQPPPPVVNNPPPVVHNPTPPPAYQPPPRNPPPAVHNPNPGPMSRDEKDIRQDAKEERKEAMDKAKADRKDDRQDAKEERKEAKDAAKMSPQDAAKLHAKDAKQDAKEERKEAKAEAKADRKDEKADAKEERKEAKQDAKDAKKKNK